MPSKRGKQPLKGSYEVGYGKPPKSGQFKKGVSGNTAGRPRGAKNRPKVDDFIRYLLEEVEREREVQIAGKPRKINGKQLLATRIFNQAGNGDHKSQRLVIDLINSADQTRAEDLAEGWTRLAEIKRDGILDSWSEYEGYWRHVDLPHPNTILRRRDRLTREILPMPDDMRLRRLDLRWHIEEVDDAIRDARGDPAETEKLQVRRARYSTLLELMEDRGDVTSDIVEADRHLLEWERWAIPGAHHLADLYVLLAKSELARFRALLAEHQQVADHALFLQALSRKRALSAAERREMARLEKHAGEVLSALNRMDPRRSAISAIRLNDAHPAILAALGGRTKGG